MLENPFLALRQLSQILSATADEKFTALFEFSIVLGGDLK